MPTLKLGVAVLPYAAPGGQTTGDVAEILEQKYHIQEVFFELHKQYIAEALESSMANALESLLVGAPSNLSPTAEATSKIEDRFKQFLSNKELDALGYPGIPTKASLMGVNRRMKTKKGGPRPSFIDTGLYQSSFKAWVD